MDIYDYPAPNNRLTPPPHHHDRLGHDHIHESYTYYLYNRIKLWKNGEEAIHNFINMLSTSKRLMLRSRYHSTILISMIAINR